MHQTPGGVFVAITTDQSHPADEFVQSAHRHVPMADEYLIDAAPPTGALIKADNAKLELEALKDGDLTAMIREDTMIDTLRLAGYDVTLVARNVACNRYP
jgi:hypothetical protein